MQMVIAFLSAAIIIEFVVAVLGDKLPAVVTQYLTANVLSLVLGLLVAFAFRLDVFAALDMATAWVWLAYACTGILLAGGSKIWHELVSKLRESRAGVSEGDSSQTYFTSTYTNIPPSETKSGEASNK